MKQWRTQDFFSGGVLHQEFFLLGEGVTPGIFSGVLHQEFVVFVVSGELITCVRVLLNVKMFSLYFSQR
jgi:hypothetical protein